MSSINDALKRARELQKQSPPNSPPGEPPLPPVEPESRSGLGLLILIVLFIAIAFFFIGLAFAKHKSPVESIAPVAPPPPVQMAAAPPVPPQPAPVVAPAVPTHSVVTPPKPAPPALQLQGILFGSGEPQAIVNGQTVYIGDNVNGFRVKTISKTNVLFIASDGTEKTLILGE